MKSQITGLTALVLSMSLSAFAQPEQTQPSTQPEHRVAVDSLDSFVGVYDLQTKNIGFCPPTLKIVKGEGVTRPLYTFACANTADCTTQKTEADGTVTTIVNNLIYQISHANMGLQVTNETNPMNDKVTGYYTTFATFHFGILQAWVKDLNVLGAVKSSQTLTAQLDKDVLTYDVQTANYTRLEATHNQCVFKKQAQ